VGFAHRAAVFVLGAVASVMLAIFDAPVIAYQLLQLVWPGFLGPKAGKGERHFMGLFDHLSLPHRLDIALDAGQLSRSGQTEGRGGDRSAPELARFNASVALVDRDGLRGERRRAAVARLWPAPRAGWLLRITNSPLRYSG